MPKRTPTDENEIHRLRCGEHAAVPVPRKDQHRPMPEIKRIGDEAEKHNWLQAEQAAVSVGEPWPA